MSRQAEPEKYGERGEKVVFGPPVEAQRAAATPKEDRGQAGSSSSGGRVPPQGGSGTAPPSNKSK